MHAAVGASEPAGASRGHDTHQQHAMAPGLVGQTIERAGGRPAACHHPDPRERLLRKLWITPASE
jgi:hypothetical protein